MDSTSLVQEVVVGKKDEQVLKALALARKTKWEDGVSQWNAGVRNESGQVYRTVHLRGLNQIVHFITLMDGLGFVEERRLTPRKINGLDTTFQRALPATASITRRQGKS